MEVGGNLHGIRSNGSRWTAMEVLWRQLEVCDTRGSRWKYIGVYDGSSSKLPLHMVVEAEAMEASISTVSESFHLLPWNPPLTFVEVKLLPFTSMEATLEVNLLPTYLKTSWRKLPWR